MQKIGLMVFKCLLLAGILQAQNKELTKFYYPDGTVSSEGYLLDGKPAGYWKNFNENGTLRSEGKMLAGKTDSTWIFYSRSGIINSRVQYSEGLKNGPRETYNEQGQLIARENFKNDKKEGFSFQYFPDGNERFRIPFQNNKEEGRGFEYDKSGNIIRFFEYSKGNLTLQKSVNRFDLAGKKTGLWIETTNNGVIIRETLFSEGLPDGYVKWYDDRGNLMKVEMFYRGVLQEEQPKAELTKEYYPNRKLRRQGSYIGNKPAGLHTSYDSSGRILEVVYYNDGEPSARGLLDENGLKTGIWQEFYPGGTLKSEGTYHQDFKQGTWRFFHASGKIEQTGQYNNGKPVGTWRWYYENGNLLRETSFINGKEEGWSVELGETGDTLSLGEYQDDEREGSWVFRQGYLTIKGAFIAGKPNGRWEQRYSGGNLSFEGEFTAGEGAGLHRAYFENGVIRWEGRYRNGKRDGTWQSFSEDGSLIISIEYREGVEIRYDGIRIKPEFEPEEWENVMQHNPYIF
jgi:uncharacterized protein